MAQVTITDQERSLLERICEQQGWERLRLALMRECEICRGLRKGLCSHR